jgi:hypothetical protein
VDVRFVAPQLELLDDINCEALAIPFFSEERPLQGAFGLVDWRLCGLISRMIVHKRINGSFKECILIPGRPRVGVEKLFLFGLGPEDAFDESVLETISEYILKTLASVGVRTFAMVLPGRATDRIEPERAIEVFLQVADSHEEHDVVIVVEPEAAQKRMAPVVELERRKARARTI